MYFFSLLTLFRDFHLNECRMALMALKAWHESRKEMNHEPKIDFQVEILKHAGEKREKNCKIYKSYRRWCEGTYILSMFSFLMFLSFAFFWRMHIVRLFGQTLAQAGNICNHSRDDGCLINRLCSNIERMFRKATKEKKHTKWLLIAWKQKSYTDLQKFEAIHLAQF